MSILISPIHIQLLWVWPEVIKVGSSDRQMFILDRGERYAAIIVVGLLFTFKFIFIQLASENNYSWLIDILCLLFVYITILVLHRFD